MSLEPRTFAFLVALVVSVPALGQTNEAIAEKLFREGQDAMKAGHYAEACAKFAASNRTDAQLGTLLNLAACHEALHKPASAWTEYTTLVDLASKAHDDARANYARKRAAALEPTLAQVEIRVPASVALTAVAIDDQRVAPAALATSIPVDPGEHRVELSTATAHWTQSVTVGPSGTTRLDVIVPSETPKPVPPMVDAGGGLRTAAYVTFGTGVAGMVLGSVFGIIAIAEKSTVDGGCDAITHLCTSDAYSATFAARTTGWVSTISFITGGVFLATSIGLFIAAGKSKRVGASAHGLVIVW